MKRLESRTVLITGGAKGVGAATALLFAQEGARVFIADRDGAAVEALKMSFAAKGHDLGGLCADVSTVAGAELAYAAANDSLGKIDVLFNHAGIMLVKPFLDCTLAE